MQSHPALITVLSLFVSAPAVLIGQLLRRGDHTRAVQVVLVELLIIMLAAGISKQRRQVD